MAKMSAQETVLQHSFSRASLMSSMIPNPRSVFTLGRAPFSLTIAVELSSSTDPSQPCRSKRMSPELIIERLEFMTKYDISNLEVNNTLFLKDYVSQH